MPSVKKDDNNNDHVLGQALLENCHVNIVVTQPRKIATKFDQQHWSKALSTVLNQSKGIDVVKNQKISNHSGSFGFNKHNITFILTNWFGFNLSWIVWRRRIVTWRGRLSRVRGLTGAKKMTISSKKTKINTNQTPPSAPPHHPKKLPNIKNDSIERILNSKSNLNFISNTDLSALFHSCESV